ncbi:uncharacterized protein LOC111356517 isoform X1 [Spodoptera litura]|uniref:Uncharacterized protein LOC111356517 isoform X1 n=1 Tax=Spodoptera litura TaxID=69820 RepID=A0A9J7IVN1_SPOLT|nr:uncharacterized protein LOC111356517 isoform X1 [Spodoptera litura]
MRSLASPYPVDRYLVESSKKFEMVNIIDDDIWKTEPALKPEDEVILRKLHDTLQSTADDLKLLSGELTKFREPGVQVKTAPTPLDEEFNEKVHIEEIVNAKFHGYKIIDKSALYVPENKSKKDTTDKPSAELKYHKTSNINAPVNVEKVNKKPIINRNLGITRTKVIHISGDTSSTKTEKLNNGTVVSAPTVAYNEYSYVYLEPKTKTSSKKLQVQEMPSINIRSELKEQKVLQLDIMPEVAKINTSETVKNNVTVVAIHHEPCKPVQTEPTVRLRDETLRHHSSQPVTSRKVFKMSTCDSSGSTNNISSDTKIKLKTQKRILKNIRTSPKISDRNDRKKKNIKKEPEQRAHLNMDEWRKKLNSVYGATSSKKSKSPQNKSSKPTLKKSNNHQENKTKPNKLNNTEYIPYSKLTVGGARASDIEREISDIPNKKDIPLSPILDRILTSRENSFSLNSCQPNDKANIFTTSDENLLQEVIDIEKTVSETLSKNLNNINTKIQVEGSESDEVKENDSYADDFEEEKSDGSGQSGNQKTNTSISNEDQKSFHEENYTSENNHRPKSAQRIPRKPISSPSHTNIQLNETYKKASNLSFKNKVDVFEYVHSVDTQDSATQSNTELKLSRKETQTSPVNDNSIQPIHNDLWPSIDPKGEVEKMFQMEKEFIKKLIVEEYGDILEKNIDKPSTSKERQITLNVAASQKDTQTSPAHVKNVMTSPTKTKTRTTSPFSKLTVDHHTSPLIFVVDEDDVKLEIENEDEPGISINLSSPRFSLRLPRTSREVFSNLGNSVPRTARQSASKIKNVKKNNITTSTSSFEADSSEISSLGEVKLARKLGRGRVVSETDSVSSSSMSEVHSGILPLRSEGEMSISHKQKYNKQHKSEGEASVGLF